MLILELPASRTAFLKIPDHPICRLLTLQLLGVEAGFLSVGQIDFDAFVLWRMKSCGLVNYMDRNLVQEIAAGLVILL